jgi:hypothetical protein
LPFAGIYPSPRRLNPVVVPIVDLRREDPEARFVQACRYARLRRFCLGVAIDFAPAIGMLDGSTHDFNLF